MSDTDRLRIALQLTRHLSVRTIAPDDDDYTGTRQERLERRDQHVVEGIAEVAGELAKERDSLLRILDDPFYQGTRITNCVVHAGKPFTERPADCHLCAADIRNHLALALRVNDFLNKKVDAAVRLLRDGQVPVRMREGAGT
jgi:hypothetical protein